MDAFLKTRVEIETIHDLLPDLDYYRILQLDYGAPQRNIDTAFRRESRRLHPDRYARIGDSALQEKVTAVYRLINEAYRCLKDPDLRARYDLELLQGSKRMSSQARAGVAHDAASQNPEQAARTPKGEKYWKMALKCWEDKDYKGCSIQIQFALAFEPDNKVFKEWLEKAKQAFDSDKDKKHMYKLRIV